MTVEKPGTGSEDLLPEAGNSVDNHTLNKERSIQQSDLRALIQSRKESEKQLNLRLTLVQAVLEGADNAIFSVDTQYRYSSFNKKHAGDMQDLYGCTIKIWEKLAGFVPVEKDRQKILRLIQQALAGERGTFGDYLGDNARKRRYFDLSYYPVRDDAGTILGAAVIARDTTVRKESEARLSLRFSLLEKIIEGADIAIFSVDAQCCYMSFNKKHAGDMRALYGSTIKAEKNLAEFVPIEKDRQKILRLIRQALAGEQGTLKDYFGDNARSRRYFDLVSYPLPDDTGLITGAAVISSDCTLEKQAEKALIDREDQYHRLVEHAPDLLFRASIPKGTYEYFSPASLVFTGYTPEEFYKKPGLLYELVHHAWKDAFGRQMEILSKGENPPASVFQIVHRNGDVRWWFFRTSVIQDAGGHPVAYEGIVTDVTDRKIEEIALEETNERFRAIVESADTGIILIDAKTHVITDANQRALEMIGSSKNEVIGADCHRFFCPSQTVTCPVTDPKERQNASEGVLITAGEKRIPVLRTVAATTVSGREMLIESFIDFSEQKKTEDCLRESRERYRAFIANSSDGVFRFELDPAVPVNLPAAEQIARFIDQGILAECNDAMARMYGYERPDEMVGQKAGGFINAGKPRTLECLHKFVRNGYHVEDFETEEHDRDGKPRWFSCTMNGIIRDNGIVCLWGVRREITGRRNAELILQKSEGRFRELTEQSIDIICTLTFSGEIRSINPAVSTHLGYLPDEVIGNKILDYLNLETQQRLLDEVGKIRNGARSDRFHEIEIRAKDGRSIPFEANVRIRTDGDGGPEIVVIAREISGRKKIENALWESEERFRALLQSVPSVAVQGFRPDYSVICWNNASSEMFGYTAVEAIGKDIRDLLVPAERRDEVTGTCDCMAATGIPGPSAELEFRHKDGTRVPVFVSHTVVKIPEKSTILFCISIDLTGRKRAELALRDAERRLQSVLDVAPFGSFVCELQNNGRLVFVWGNRSADQILRTDCSRFAGNTIEEAFPVLARTALPDTLRKVALNGEPFHHDDFAYDTDEIPGIFEIHALPLPQNRIAVFFWDISEKKKVEVELEQSERRFRALIQNSPDIIQILDQEKQMVYSSPSFSKILGYSEGSRHSGCIPDFVHPEDRDRVAADLEEVYTRTNPQTSTEYRMLTADGNFLYVESVGVNLLGVPGVEGVVITTHIVHERKQAEQALQEREERFRLIFQHSNDAVYLFEITPAGMPGKIVDANDAAVRQSGYSKAELVHKSLPDICSRDLTRRSRAIMMELLTRGEARFETESIRKDGALLPVEISARPVKLRDRTCAIAISRDISQRLREDRALRIANQKLQLMNIVSWHDIQNKVTALRGYAALSKDLATNEKLKKFIDSQEDILKVIHRQLQYTKEYQEMGVHPPQWVNLPQVLRTIISFRGLGSLTCRMDIDNLELYCDPVIEKVFSHLIENTQNHAQKATEIRISCRKTPDGLSIIYEDDGIGIPIEKKKDLFIQGAGTSTGFSLFFVHDILEICEMTIRETGEPGSGVRFEISVPKGLYRIGRNEA
jgi:PAS domain S-box-containing protein